LLGARDEAPQGRSHLNALLLSPPSSLRWLSSMRERLSHLLHRDRTPTRDARLDAMEHAHWLVHRASESIHEAIEAGMPKPAAKLAQLLAQGLSWELRNEPELPSRWRAGVRLIAEHAISLEAAANQGSAATTRTTAARLSSVLRMVEDLFDCARSVPAPRP
jgi:hypothetical protein